MGRKCYIVSFMQEQVDSKVFQWFFESHSKVMNTLSVSTQTKCSLEKIKVFTKRDRLSLGQALHQNGMQSSAHSRRAGRESNGHSSTAPPVGANKNNLVIHHWKFWTVTVNNWSITGSNDK